MQEAEIFEKIYWDYLAEVFSLDPDHFQDRLGVCCQPGEIVVPFFGRPHRLTPGGITDPQGCRPSHSVSVILCKYLILCPKEDPVGSDWVTYKDYPDAAPFAAGFLNNAEKPIAKNFAGRLVDLEAASTRLGGQPVDIGIASDLVVRFDALPKLPLAMIFNDRDEDFPAECSLLFERRAEKYLDMECLAIAGWALSEWLKRFSADGLA